MLFVRITTLDIIIGAVVAVIAGLGFATLGNIIAGIIWA